VERLTVKGRYGDGLGLYLQVHSATNRSWLFRYKINGRTRWMGLGPITTYTLDEARELARKARQQIKEGLCPLAESRKTKLMRNLALAKDKTFKQCAEDYFTFHKDKWGAKWQENFTRMLGTYVYPKLGSLSVADIDTGLVLQCVEPIWKSKTTTADQV